MTDLFFHGYLIGKKIDLLMNYTFLKLGSLFALLGVILGAFGAHGLQNYLSADQLDTFDTGIRYQFYHALALILLAILTAPMKNHRFLRYAGCLLYTSPSPRDATLSRMPSSA